MPQSYKREKPSGKFDALIIGSGMSGMALAAILAKEGKRCLILERHYTPGGFTHVFKRRDYEWDVGIHYIGEVHRPKSMLRKIFDHISDKQLAWADMGDVYDRIVFGDRSYDFVKGVEPFREKMKNYFHSEAD
jgi:all-trans-retinol 13,14-reductase